VNQEELIGRVAVVTGASRGVGREIAVGLAAHGADVILAARSEPDLIDVSKSIAEQGGGRAILMPTDVRNIEQVAALRLQTEASFGVADILINAAAIYGPLAPFSQSDPEEWSQTLLVNTVGAYLTCREFLGGMLEQGWGRILNVSSSASLWTPGVLGAAYSTSKAALNRLTRHLAAELDGSPVSACVFHPGAVNTQMWEDIRAQAEELDERAEDFRYWADLLQAEGGDPARCAFEVVLHVVRSDAAETNGRFLWPQRSIEDRVESW
jgi:NAD(P)-dependent dehydrogenase (short-subunit alcohol dehydrogenase family)